MGDSFGSESPRSGQRSQLRLAVAAVLFCVPALVACWGFTVDDALVTARVASHLASGQGHRFNPGGPEVDAVTPLGWAHILALGGSGEALAVLQRARWIGVIAWLGAAALLGALLGRAPSRGRRTAWLLLAVSTPAAAWASSGMETGLVTLLATAALVGGSPGALFGGLAAGLRPELVPWAVVLAVGGALIEGEVARRRAGRVAQVIVLALGPALVVAVIRQAWFGSPAPLALSAKPPDLLPGLRYAFGATIFAGAPLVLLAPWALARSSPHARRLALAVAAHLSALALAGGDWMPLYRLFVPVLPTVLLAGALLAEHASPRAHYLRVLLATGLSLVVAALVAWPARSVLETRVAFIESLRAPLRGGSIVACVDAGLVGAATDRPLLDLAGVTDASVASLAGGHTSKRIPDGLIESRGVDRAVLQLAPGAPVAPRWQDSEFARAVEQRLAALPSLERFELVAVLPLGATAHRFVVVALPTTANRERDAKP